MLNPNSSINLPDIQLRPNSSIKVIDVQLLPFGLKIEGILPFEHSSDEDFAAYFALTDDGKYEFTSMNYHYGKRTVYNAKEFSIFLPIFEELEKIANEKKVN